MISRAALLLAVALVCGSAQAQGAGAAPKAARSVLVDRILAVVNREVITQFELTERVERALRELRARRTPLPSREEIERQMLERMIVDRVQLQYAKETGLQIDDLQLDAAINRIAEGNRMSLAEFRRALERDAIPFDKFREEVRAEIVMTRLREREVDNKITVAENEITNLLEEQQAGGEAMAEYNFGHILLQVPEQARPEQLDRQRARAEEAVKRLKSGGDFAQLAATYSDGPTALQGGDMGWRAQDRMPELFAEALAKMRPGEVSGVLRSPAGFHILKLNDKRGAGAPFMVEQTRMRHILARVSEVVSEEDAKRKLVLLRERIVNGADFGELARQHSDDASAGRGGELGWIYPGDTVPEFERAFTALAPMRVSEPVKTPFGWHLIQVLERRTADASSERKRLEARKALRERKSDEAYQEGLRQLRDRAYVEYRIEDR
ncbi:MAG: peptidylprolyl isomerase [Betaproteobacteria bacterium]|nr:peptidylprolyl isomerase [Betaproteobacteria bacterium]